MRPCVIVSQTLSHREVAKHIAGAMAHALKLDRRAFTKGVEHDRFERM